MKIMIGQIKTCYDVLENELYFKKTHPANLHLIPVTSYLCIQYDDTI